MPNSVKCLGDVQENRQTVTNRKERSLSRIPQPGEGIKRRLSCAKAPLTGIIERDTLKEAPKMPVQNLLHDLAKANGESNGPI